MAKPAVIGIDLGAQDSYVAFVGKGIVDIVQNEVSKRATPSLVGFTDRERLLGDPALSLIRSNAKNSCRNFKHLLGRDVSAPDIATEHFWSTSKLSASNDKFTGYDVTYKGESKVISATEITAMYFTKLKDITESWCGAKVSDAVIAVPSSFSDVQRQALLDAAKIANLSVLRVMNEHTATALAYGIYRSNDFDAEKPTTTVFCSVGHSIFSVSIVQFVKGKLTVVCEKSDKVGGRDMDECLMRAFAEQFKKKHGCDPLSNKKAAFKLEDAVGRTKKILSANNEAPVNVECLMEDEDFSSTMNRNDFEKMCEPMMDRVKKVLEDAKVASGMTPEQIDNVEIVGGSSRVPWIKNMISEAFGGKTLSTTMNQEESVARGCALQAAILSPLYKVRDFKVEDNSPYAVNIGWTGSGSDGKVEDDGDAQMGGAEGECKKAEIFPSNSQMNMVKMCTWFRKGPFDITAEIANPDSLPKLTPKELGKFRVDLPPQPANKKIKVKTQLTLHGTFAVSSAQMVEEEDYEETIKEKRELPPLPDSEEEPTKEEGEKTADGEAAKAENGKDEVKKDENGAEEKKDADADGDANMGDAKEAAAEAPKDDPPPRKEKEKRYEWIDVVKKKRRTKKTDLKIIETGRPGLGIDLVHQKMDEETKMTVEMREIQETDAKRNDLEGYLLSLRDKTSSSGECGPYISDEAREKFHADLTKTEDWLYDTFDATKSQLLDKLDELKSVGDEVVWRGKEAGMRGEWIEAVAGTVKNYRAAVDNNGGDKYGHIAEDKLAKIVTACNELETWLNEKKAAQEKLAKYERPVLLCAEMESKNKELARVSDEILREPKPAPPKETKKVEAEEDEEAAKGDAEEEEAPTNPDAEVEADKMEVD